MTRCRRVACLLLAFAMPSAAARGDGITFEELPAANDNCCFLSDEYAEMGVRFETTDDGSIWAGHSNGDPGFWRLEGSNGPAFLGFNGRSYAARLLFDAPIADFSMDVARAHGSSGRVKVKLTGYLAGDMVGQAAVLLGGTNHWLPVSLDGEIDEVLFHTSGSTGFRPYGVDNLAWEPAGPQWIPVEIDIQPDSVENRIHPGSRGVVPVLLLGSEELGVDQVRADSLAFGPDAAPRAHRNGPHYTDANEDGLLDLLAHFRVPETGLQADDAELCLTGETLDGVPIEGCDAVSPVGQASADAGPAGRSGRGRGGR